jgi:hypothetical protein
MISQYSCFLSFGVTKTAKILQLKPFRRLYGQYLDYAMANSIKIIYNLLAIYEVESVNSSQMDIKLKICDIRTDENIYFSTYPPPILIHLSHRFANASKAAA